MSEANPVITEVNEPTKDENVAKRIAERFPNVNVEVKINKWGRRRVWVRVPREDYKALMRFIEELDPEAHYSIGVEQDLSDELGFVSHLVVHYRDAPAVSLIVDVHAPKDNPVLPDISDVFPIALQFERECAEMVGLDFEGAPDKRRLFLPDDFPEGIYPLRLDDKGISDEMAHNAGHPYLLGGGKK
ncbi:NADH-quinone oxidoreductase subunit C [Thermococcus sp. Bubb.Bath]|uniref:NADH-quinone oxidoreductase subunit C n=1 Tax=Thermococcus sp. Bubb.Bath TaxID=1638242 RepID=UPI00143A134F|nr:NADH-quinone oxidoreductase subunit C [Thermococcus sp. Bubb.Bath]NJF25119.1 hydrogenase [Thermococcus sp. Bubb.Bath]